MFSSVLTRIRKLVTGGKSSGESKNWYHVAAVYRLAWENSFQLGTAENPGVFDEQYAERLSNQATHFAREVGRLSRSVLYADALLLVLISTKGKLPPVYGFDLSTLSFAAEALILWSSMAFAFLAVNMVNQQAYESLLGSWCWKRHPHDANDLLASYVPNQLVLRVLRKKLSSPFGADRLRPGKTFFILNTIAWAGILFLTIIIPAIQIGIIGTSVQRVMEVQNLGWTGSFVVSLAGIAATLFAVFIVFATMILPLPVQVINMLTPVKPNGISTTGDYLKMAEEHFLDLDKASRPSIAEMEKKIEGQFANVAADQKVQELTRALAYASLIIKFEQIYRMIFGSQIAGLRSLNEIGDATLDNAKEFFQARAVAAFPEQYKNTSFDQWLEFLVERNLVERAPANVAITEFGREFLRFLDGMKYSDNLRL